MAVGKPVITTRLYGIVKEFGDGNGIEYVTRPEETLQKANELIEANVVKEFGMKGSAIY